MLSLRNACRLTLLVGILNVLAGCAGGTVSSPIATPVAAPTVTALAPLSASVGANGITLTVTGTNFLPGTEITWRGSERATLYVSATSLQTTLTSVDLAAAGTVAVGVEDPQTSGGVSSTTLPFLISVGGAPNPLPVLTSIAPASAPAGAASTTITLSGANFVSGSTVLVNGSTPLTSTLLSSASMTAVLPASLLQTAGSLPITVMTAAPGGGTTASVAFAVTPPATSGTTVLNVWSNSLAWDAVNQVIYLSIPSAAGSNGNTVQVLNPFTGNLGTSVFAGSEPNLLSVSANSQYLYTSLDGSSSLVRLKLPSLQTDLNFSFGSGSSYSAYVAMDLQASPVADGTVAFVLGSPGISPEEEGGVHIYDNAVPRATALCGFIQATCTTNSLGSLFDSIQWAASGNAMYMLNNEDTGFNFYTVPVTSTGFGKVVDYGALAGGFGDKLHYDASTALLYSDEGVVIDPATGLKAGSFNASGLAVPDGKTGIIFFLSQPFSGYGSGTYTLQSFDIKHFTPIATMTIKNVTGTPTHLIRWGTNGLAFTTSPGYFSSGTGQVYLISGSFVTTI